MSTYDEHAQPPCGLCILAGILLGLLLMLIVQAVTAQTQNNVGVGLLPIPTYTLFDSTVVDAINKDTLEYDVIITRDSLKENIYIVPKLDRYIKRD